PITRLPDTSGNYLANGVVPGGMMLRGVFLALTVLVIGPSGLAWAAARPDPADHAYQAALNTEASGSNLEGPSKRYFAYMVASLGQGGYSGSPVVHNGARIDREPWAQYFLAYQRIAPRTVI